MIYSVQEIFYTLQGEGSSYRTSSRLPAVFCVDNLWSGREDDRANAISASSAIRTSLEPFGAEAGKFDTEVAVGGSNRTDLATGGQFSSKKICGVYTGGEIALLAGCCADRCGACPGASRLQ